MYNNNWKIILICLLLLSNISFGQEEYFIQLNPATCSYTIIDSIPGVKWIGLSSSFYDKINNRYYFTGQDASSSNFLYGIDATNGNVISNPQFTANMGLIRFDNSSNNLYGLFVNGSLAYTYFISVNPINLNYTIIGSSFCLTSLNNEATIDEINNRFIFPAGDSVGNNCLFSIDILTGNIISKPIVNSICGFQFDNSSGNLYGLHIEPSSFIGTFNLIDPTNGNITLIDTIQADLSGGGTSMGYYTFDEINKRYTFCGVGNNNLSLYTIDATDGQVIYAPQFPTLINPYNIIETKYDNSAGILYALHWGPKNLESIDELTSNNDLFISPNPSSGAFQVENYLSKIEAIKIFNAIGVQVFEKTVNSEQASVNLNVLDGVYFVQVICKEGTIVKKIIIQQ